MNNFNQVNPELAHVIGQQGREPTPAQREAIRLHNIETLVLGMLPPLCKACGETSTPQQIVNKAFKIAEVAFGKFEAAREKAKKKFEA